MAVVLLVLSPQAAVQRRSDLQNAHSRRKGLMSASILAWKNSPRPTEVGLTHAALPQHQSLQVALCQSHLVTANHTCTGQAMAGRSEAAGPLRLFSIGGDDVRRWLE